MSELIEYRQWKFEDRDQLVKLIQAYITEACPDLVPSEKNANLLFESAGTSSHVAVNIHWNKIIGFTLLSPIDNIETKVKMLHSIGTYVERSYRRRGIAEALRRLAMLVAAHEGYKMLQGYAYGGKQADSVVKLGGRVVGMVLECPLGE